VWDSIVDDGDHLPRAADYASLGQSEEWGDIREDDEIRSAGNPSGLPPGRNAPPFEIEFGARKGTLVRVDLGAAVEELWILALPT
jgi:hypothetical protein